MKTVRLIAVVLAGLLGMLSGAGAQQLSNMGKDFWIGYGHHVRMANTSLGPEKMQLYITGETATTGKMSIPGIGFEQIFAVAPRTTTTIDIPRTAALNRDGLSNLGIHVTAEHPVVVYSFIFASAVSGATVCLPTNTLGRDYYSINYDQISNENNCSSYFFVVAADTGTTSVEITPSANTIAGKTANVPFVVQMQQGQVYQVLGATSGYNGVDLTGSRIRSVNTGMGCKKIAVFSGSSKISIGCLVPGTSDNLYQQAYPTATWSRKYIAIPSMVNSRNFFRIIRPDPTTTVRVNNQVIPASAFTRNFYYQFSGNQPFVVEADKAIMVAQYFPSEGCSGNTSHGDPDMVFLNPVDQNLNQVTLNAMQPTGVNIRQHYLNVVLPNTPGAINSFKIDGMPHNGFQPVPADNGYAYAQITTTRGTHYLSCDMGYNVISYGFGSAESYGYSGGTRLRDLYQVPSIANEYARLDSAVTCAGSPFRLSMTFPFQPQQIRWQFGGLLPDVVVRTPVPDSVFTINGKPVYRFTMPGWQRLPETGTYPVKLLVSSNIGDGCITELEIEHELKVYPKPVSSFTFQTKGCTEDSVWLQETFTRNNILAPKAWLWRFDSLGTAQRPNPTVRYTRAGTYTLQLAVINELGCISDTATQRVTVNPRPEVGFQVQGPFCVSRPVSLTNNTRVSTGSIAVYTWHLGDGTRLQTALSQPPKHVFRKPGNYTVQLDAVSDKGCTGLPDTQTLSVTPMPKAGFSAPFTCLGDPFTPFTNLSTISGPDSTLAFRWNFGAGFPIPDTNRHTQHRYTVAGNYPVTLIALSAGGCADTVQQTVTVSGAHPQASFSLRHGDNQCSDTALVLYNNSSVDGGKLFRMELYWDYTVNRNQNEVVHMPAPGATYRFAPPPFHSPQSRQYTVRMVVHSGQSCQAASEQVVTVHALPKLQFDTLPRFCSADSSYNITQVRLLNNLSGTGTFHGPGVIAAGIFSPTKARIGENRLGYTFVSDRGCSATVRQAAIVYRSPLVNAGPDLVVRRGKWEQIKARSGGANLSYTWTPTAGLSNAQELQPVASPQHDQTYQLTATTVEGCTATDEVHIKAPDHLYIPNSFTPNGDGINDLWRIPYLMSMEKVMVRVYNRDGYCVYENNGGPVAWDGRHKGVALNGGTFVYVMTLEGSTQVYKGTLILIR